MEIVNSTTLNDVAQKFVIRNIEIRIGRTKVVLDMYFNMIVIQVYSCH